MEEIQTIRMKKLFSTILAEFKPNATTAELTREEEKKFRNLNTLIKNSKLQFLDDNFDDMEVKRSNQKILGMCSDDLRQYLLHHY